MDDETYAKAYFKQIPGVKFYKAYARGNVPKSGKKPTVFVTIKNINSDLCKKEYFKNQILPFVRSHDGSLKFWPDVATRIAPNSAR
uniref:Uncharacterized protein n=1 Tax=Anopheles minimus TaxID=112268 RepID=A0A182VRU0_9DIPT